MTSLAVIVRDKLSNRPPQRVFPEQMLRTTTASTN